MTTVDVLHKVKDVENEHEERILKAKAEADKLISGAAREAKEIIEKAKEEANRKSAEFIKEAEKEAVAELGEKKIASEKEIIAIKDLAVKNMEQAISFIVERIVR